MRIEQTRLFLQSKPFPFRENNKRETSRNSETSNVNWTSELHVSFQLFECVFVFMGDFSAGTCVFCCVSAGSQKEKLKHDIKMHWQKYHSITMFLNMYHLFYFQ